MKRWLKVCLLLLLFQLREYTLTESYHEDDVLVEFVSNDNLQANSEAPRGIDPNRDLNEAIAEERREMDTQRYRYAIPHTTTVGLLSVSSVEFFTSYFCGLTGVKSCAFVYMFNNQAVKIKKIADFLCFYISALSNLLESVNQFK